MGSAKKPYISVPQPDWVLDQSSLYFIADETVSGEDASLDALEAIRAEVPVSGQRAEVRAEVQSVSLVRLISQLQTAFARRRPLAVVMRQTRARGFNALLDQLVEKDYIILQEGFYQSEGKNGKGPSYKGEPHKLYASRKLIKHFPIPFDFQLVRDRMIYNVDKDNPDKNNPDFIPADKPAEHARVKRVLEAHNNLLSGRVSMPLIHEGRVIVFPIDPHTRAIYSYNGLYGIFEHGRLYGKWTEFSRTSRATILFDGQETSEPDFSSLHPRLLYFLEGRPSPDDVYTCILDALQIRDSDRAIVRKIVKNFVLFLINAKDEGKATKAVFGKWYKELRGTNLDKAKRAAEFYAGWNNLKRYGVTAKSLSATIKTVHAPIARYFCTGIGAKLQAFDAKIAVRVIELCNSAKIPVLPVHDSFICKISDKLRVESIMQTALIGEFKNWAFLNKMFPTP